MTVMSIKERSHLVSELNTRHIPAPRSRTVLAATAVATVGEERMLPDWQTRRLVDPPERIWRDNGFDDPEVSATDDVDPELDFYTEMRQVVAEEFGLTPGQVRQHQEVIDRYTGNREPATGRSITRIPCAQGSASDRPSPPIARWPLWTPMTTSMTCSERSACTSQPGRSKSLKPA